QLPALLNCQVYVFGPLPPETLAVSTAVPPSQIVLSFAVIVTTGSANTLRVLVATVVSTLIPVTTALLTTVPALLACAFTVIVTESPTARPPIDQTNTRGGWSGLHPVPMHTLAQLD